MFDQAFVINHVSERIVERLEQLEIPNEKKKVTVFPVKRHLNEEGNAFPEGVILTFLGLEAVYMNNQFERIQKKHINNEGKEVEYTVQPASMFKCEYMIQPVFESMEQVGIFLGMIIRLFKDNNTLELGEYDWAGNNGYPITISAKAGFDINAQMNVFNQLKSVYGPALFYEVLVGIDSSIKERFTRVEERKFDMFGKKDDKKKS